MRNLDFAHKDQFTHKEERYSACKAETGGEGFKTSRGLMKDAIELHAFWEL